MFRPFLEHLAASDLSPKTIQMHVDNLKASAVNSSVPPGYRRQQPVRRPKLDSWVAVIDQILNDDKAQGKKQRHTAKRIFDRLRDEHAYTGGYTIVKDYVRLRKLSQREMFVPLKHPPGDAQADSVKRKW